MTKSQKLDPFAEVEADYVGPEADTQEVDPDESLFDADDAAFDPAPYDFDSDDGDDFDFPDDPDDWTPPTAPDPAGERSFTGPAAPAAAPQPAKRRAKNVPDPVLDQIHAPVGDLVTVETPTLEESQPKAVPTVAPVRRKPTPEQEEPEPEDTAPAVPRKRPADRPDAEKPKKGLRGFLRSLFNGSQGKGQEDDLRSLQRGVSGAVNIVMVNRKGGTGKTLTTTLAGMTLATHRGDRVIAVDASPEGGELCDRVEREQFGSVRSLIDQLDSVSRYSHVRTHTSQDASGLEVLGSDPEAVGEPVLTGDEYRRMMKVLRDYYSVILTDCAQGLSGPLMESVLDEADVLVLVSEGADGMRSASWVASQLADEHGAFDGKYAHLVDDLIVVVNSRTPRTNVDTDRVAEFFESFARSVIQLPFDQEVEGGRAFTLDEVSADTRDAGIDLALAIANSSGFLDGGR